MFVLGPRKIRRRYRMASACALAGLFTYSVSLAQADKDWVETALERTLRLSAPWELPLNPQLDPNSSHEKLISPELAPEIELVLEVPWATDASKQADAQEEQQDQPLAAHLVVRSVDHFEDPWDRSEPPAPESQLKAPKPRSEAKFESESEPASSSYEDPTLIDPWTE